MKLQLGLGLKSSSKRSRSPLRQSGFTIIELLVVIGILGVGFGMAAWSITGLLPKWRLQGAANEVVMRFQQARGLAIKSNDVAVVELANGTSGYIKIWEDLDSSNTSSGADLLKSNTDIYNTFNLAYIQSITDGNGAAIKDIAISPDGTIRSIDGAAGRGTMPIRVTVTSQISTTPSTYVVRIDRSGIARIQ